MRWQDKVETLEKAGLYQHIVLCHYNGTTVAARGNFTLAASEVMELFERLSTRRAQHIVLGGKTFLTVSNDGVVLVAARPGVQVVCGRKLVSCLVAVTEDHDTTKRKLAEEQLRAVITAPDGPGPGHGQGHVPTPSTAAARAPSKAKAQAKSNAQANDKTKDEGPGSERSDGIADSQKTARKKTLTDAKALLRAVLPPALYLLLS